MINKKVKKLIVILGPTATGKTKLAVRLSAKFGGEIISADSRQVYRGLDIGTGKDLSEYKNHGRPVAHHLIDVVGPKADFSVGKYQKLAYRSIDKVLARGKVPFLVGGTGLYLDAVTKGYVFPQSEDPRSFKLELVKIRKRLDAKSLAWLLKKLKEVDPSTYKKIDQKNRRRVQRAVEIYYQTGLPKSRQPKLSAPPYHILTLGVGLPLPEIYRRIDRRLSERLREGMIEEVRKLRRRGVSWKRLEDWGLEYRYVGRYLRGLLDDRQLEEQLKSAIHHFAKRQLTWFKRNPEIIWVDGYLSAEKKVKNFLDK